MTKTYEPAPSLDYLPWRARAPDTDGWWLARGSTATWIVRVAGGVHTPAVAGVSAWAPFPDKPSVKGRTPYGYTRDDSGTVVPVPEEQRVIATIVDLIDNMHLTFPAVADHLNLQGVPTKRGGAWHRSTVHSIWAREQVFETQQANLEALSSAR